MARGIEWVQGHLCRDGVPQYLLSVEYPYDRDDAANWPDRLRELKGLGVPAVAFSVPWRHHEIAGEWDFDGRTQPSRNLVGLLKLVQAAGLLALVKLGPFVGTGLPHGGLPDDVVNSNCFEAMRNRQGEPLPLPAPQGRDFSARALAWLQACLEAAVFPLCYPDGPVVALQLLNEGGEEAGFGKPDYSEVALAGFHRRFGPRSEVPERFAPPTAVVEVLPYLWWGRIQTNALVELYRRFAVPLQESGLPIFVNQPAPAGTPGGLDWWLTRIAPERWTRVHYGFSCRGEPANESLDAFCRYLLTARRQKGINLEADWSREGRDGEGCSPFFEAVLAIACGATGCNVTSLWGSNQAGALRLLARYLERYGGEIVTARREAAIHWAIYPPYATLAAWSDRREDWVDLGVKPPRSGARALEHFVRAMRRENRDFGLVNVEEAGRLDPLRYPVLTLCGGFLMDVATQNILLAYVRRGGTLILAHEWPVLNDQLEICTLLRDGLEVKPGAGRVLFLEENPFEERESPEFLRLLNEMGYPSRLVTDDPETQAWALLSDNGAVHYCIFSLSGQPGLRRAGPVTVQMPGRSAAILRVMDGRLTAALVKGDHGRRGDAAVRAACGGVEVTAETGCDLLWLAEDEQAENIDPE